MERRTPVSTVTADAVLGERTLDMVPAPLRESIQLPPTKAPPTVLAPHPPLSIHITMPYSSAQFDKTVELMYVPSARLPRLRRRETLEVWSRRKPLTDLVLPALQRPAPQGWTRQAYPG